MGTITIYRRQSVKVKRMGKVQLATALIAIGKRARVNRDALVEFFLCGEFNRLPVTPQSVIDSPVARENAQGWVLPVDCLGRKGEATASVAESVRLWIKQNLAAYGVDPDSVSVVYQAGE